MHADLVGLGAVVLLSGLLARAGRRIGLPTIPCCMVTGILLGPGTPGTVLIERPEDLAVRAALGLVLLLFHLGVESRSIRWSAAGGGSSSLPAATLA